jgi:RNA polymerase sigma factor (sigma-70 family)
MFTSTRESTGVADLLDRHRPGIYRFLRARGLSPEDAEDLTQETLIRAYRFLPAAMPGKLGCWLCAIARNAVVDRVRRRRVATVPLEGVTEADSQADPETRLLGDPGPDLAEMLERLPSGSREALRLRYLEGRSLDEMAELLHCSPGAAKQRVFRAVSALRKLASPATTTGRRR